MHFHPFVLPFLLGLIFIVVFFVVKIIYWYQNLLIEEKIKFKQSVFTVKTWLAIKEVFFESLLHRKVFKINPLLGYMHSSIAFGWFLLIVIGNFESRLYHPSDLNPPYYPIFLSYFDKSSHEVYWFAGIFKFVMNLLLLIILTGVSLAVIKRFYAELFSMKKTSSLKWSDKIPLYALWLIFPFRLLAESVSAGYYHNGGFLTNSLGSVLSSFIPEYPFVEMFYWLYSISLGIFFISLPWSRYMHIPSEVVFIFFRNYGVDFSPANKAVNEVEVLSCSRCGICIDTCQIMSSARVNHIQAVYFIRGVREKKYDENKTFNCLMCGRCSNICPVGIDVNKYRLSQRIEANMQIDLPADKFKINPLEKAKVGYFAGCMTHLTPSVKEAMIQILNQSGSNWIFLDEKSGICCGRPAKLAGLTSKAISLQNALKELIASAEIQQLVTSCPICLKTFREDYKLSIPVDHHSVFINQLIKDKKLIYSRLDLNAVYHDPCEMGRGLGIYDEPRELLDKVIQLRNHQYEKDNALCCGGSLAGFRLTNQEKELITKDALEKMNVADMNILATSCPMCKKTFARYAGNKVSDIAEIVAMAMKTKEGQKHISEQISIKELL